MDKWISLIVIFVTLIHVHTASAQTELKAKFSMMNIRGTATFTMSGEDAVQVSFGMETTIEGTVTVELHPIWVDYNVGVKCSDDQLKSAELWKTEHSLTSPWIMSGIKSLQQLEGKSLVIKISDKVVCATIEQPDATFTTAVATFRSSSIFGHVTLRQASTNNAITRIVTDLTSEKTSLVKGKWRITDSYSSCEDFFKKHLVNIYSPTPAGEDCSASNMNKCAVGDLSTKHGEVKFNKLNQDWMGRQGYTDTNLPLTGEHSVVGLLMVIVLDGLNPVCGKIKMYKTRKAVATFSNEGITGSLTFTQSSPFDSTTTDINLEGLKSRAGGFHVHKWPVPEKVSLVQGNLCAPEYVSGHWNPYKDIIGVPSDSSYPKTPSSTDDMYEIGDLSGKYGSLAGSNEKSLQFIDWNLPLFGKNSIIGRSIVIHNADGSRLVCTNILPQGDVIAAQAIFTEAVIGHVTFVQTQEEKGLQDVSVFSTLDFLNGGPGNEDNQWKISSKVLTPDILTKDLSDFCASAADMVYNPNSMMKDIGMVTYTQACETTYGQVACKEGDLTHQLGKLPIRNAGNMNDKAAKMFTTNTILSLHGKDSIIGKTLVILNSESEPLACATIQPAHPTHLVAKFNTGSMVGKVKFAQKFGVWARPTSVENMLTGLGAGKKLEIHELPSTSSESCDDMGMIYDPVGRNIDTPSTDDMFKIGGQFDNRGSSWDSFNLPLTGPNSIRGRSLVVVDQSSKVLACAAITFDEESSGASHWSPLRSVATFTGQVDGSISMEQYVNKDGSMSDTTILLHVNSSQETVNHNWHTHEKLVSGDSDATTQRCKSTGGHYNPFSAVVSSEVYKTECLPTHPLHCELGDQARKTGTVNFGKRILVTDTYLPLFGRYTVQGRSIVIHAENKGAPRIACADIVPAPPSSAEWVTDVVFTTPHDFSSLTANEKVMQVQDTYSRAIRAHDGEVVVVMKSSTSTETAVSCYFLGPRGKVLKSRFQLQLERKKFTKFNSMNSAGRINLSMFLALMCLVFSVVSTK